MKTKNKNAVKKIGRPEIKITEELCKKAEVYAAQGLTMPQIASVLGMSETTLYDKKGKFTEFSEAIKRGKDKGSTNDLNTIERALESALIDESESRKDEKVFKRVYQE